MKSIDRKRLIGKISEKKIKRFFVNLVIDKIYSFIKKKPCYENRVAGTHTFPKG